jgi:uncharacterized coiled-coil protein SlyX
MDERLTRLEELYANQTLTLEQMSQEMFAQQQEIISLQRQLKILAEKMEASGAEIGGNERPPHY